MNFIRRFAIAFAIAFAGLTSGAVVAEQQDATPTAGNQASGPPKVKMAPTETAIFVTDMHCAGCAKKIAGRLYRVKGVLKVRADVKADVAIVTPQAKKRVDPKAAWSAVQAAGFKPTRLISPQGVFVPDAKGLKKEVAQAPTAAGAVSR